MSLIKKLWNKKVKRTVRLSGILTGLFGVVALPLFSGSSDLEEYYRIVINKKAYGCYKSCCEAVQELAKVRKNLAANQSEPVLIDALCTVQSVSERPKTDNADEIQKVLYKELKKKLEQNVQSAYTIKVNEFTVTVASEEAVLATLENITNKYDTADCFTVRLQSNEEKDILNPVCVTKEGIDTAGMEDIGFEQEIEIKKSYIDASEVTEPVSAAAALTKEYETPVIYTVEKGDCLSVIAEKNGMKTKELMELNQLTDSEYINIGDELLVTVPKPEVSVWYKVRASYEEDYQADVQYIDNDKWYIGTEKVIQKGTTGHRFVVANIIYNNGKESGRELLEQNIMIESQPKIIERGTITPPTYIKPLVGGRFSSSYGSRWGRMHKGVDWACSVGTSIKASCGGTVSSAGWVNGYGYCIMIRHPDGKQTRYAHLSKILVSTGEKVEQGEKIALSGNTGNSTGPHLHFEILVNGTQVNPMKYLQ